MNFTRTDIYILMGSFMVVVFMSFVFPALGLANEGASENNVPQYDLDANTVELVGDRPDFPSSPTGGEIQYQEGIPIEQRQVVLFDNPDNQGAVFLETYCMDVQAGDCTVILTVFDNDGNAADDSYQINESDFTNQNITSLSAENNETGAWKTQIEFTSVDNWGSNNVEYTISWELLESGEGSGIENVPIIGGIYQSAEGLVSVLGWLVTTAFWFATWLVELAINLIGILVSSILFGIDLLSYMTTNYSSMLSDASGIASFVLLIPVVLLSIEFLKLGFIFVKLLPTT